jgi:hypothetical protein
MPLNAACLEGESKEFTFTGFNDLAIGRIDDAQGYKTPKMNPFDAED